MKKLVTVLLAAMMILACVACGNNSGEVNNQEKENNSENTIKEANEILTKVWNNYKENASEELQFSIAGGNLESQNMDTPATFDLSMEYAEDELVSSYCIPADSIKKTDSIATMMNAMMANNFSAAAYHVTNASDVEGIVSDIKETTLNNHWMCGTPEKFIVVVIGEDYVVSAFGNGQVMDAFKDAIVAVYGDDAAVYVEENITQ